MTGWVGHGMGTVSGPTYRGNTATPPHTVASPSLPRCHTRLRGLKLDRIWMVLDYHTIPGIIISRHWLFDSYTLTAMSVNIERTFSCARQLIGWERNCLSAQSIQALMCLGSWSRAGYVSNNILAEVTKDGAVQVAKKDMEKKKINFPDGYDRIESDWL